jgi:sortase (surface protein transpeptidase)
VIWPPPGRTIAGAALLVTALLLGVGYLALAQPGAAEHAAPPVHPSAHTSAARTVATSAPAARTVAAQPPGAPAADPNSKPVRLVIPAIGVDSTLQALGLAKDGSLQSPTSYGRAGWYAKGVIPGSVGPAVIAGHVDSVAGPGVFFRLRDLKAGDRISVQRQDGTVLHFVVDDVHAYPKAQFPTTAVYGPTPLPVLRLVTCTGDFDYRARSYLSNLVVSAHLS